MVPSTTFTQRRIIQFRPALSTAWKIYKTDPGIYLKILLTLFGSWVTLEILVSSGNSFGAIYNLAIHLIFLILFSGLLGGFLKISVLAWKDQQPRYAQLFNLIPQSTKYFTAGLIYALGSSMGLLLFIIPGIYFGARYSFFGYFLLEDRISPAEALARSGQIVGKDWNRMPGPLLALLALNICGAALLGIGLFITIPLSVLTLTGLHLQFVKDREEAIPS